MLLDIASFIAPHRFGGQLNQQNTKKLCVGCETGCTS
jgi:hypothetical protein